MKLELADIATNEKKRLQGFKVMGIFPFHLSFITTRTHIKLCRVREQIHQITKAPVLNEDFYNPEIQEKLLPLMEQYCLIGLLNERNFSWFFGWFLKRKLKKCGHYHIWNLYHTLFKMNEPAFFLAYWIAIRKVDNTLLKEEKL